MKPKDQHCGHVRRVPFGDTITLGCVYVFYF